jgi:predicted neuraminidase
MLATSGDGGHTWSEEKLVIDPDGDGPVRAFDPQLWLDPVGRLWAFWAQTIGHEGTIAGVWALTTKDPDDEEPDWSEPRRLTNGVMMGKPIVLSSGEWVLPVSTWRETDGSAKVVVSLDRGRQWQVRGSCHVPQEVRSFDEHMIVERKDGTLWMLVRTTYGIGESTSSDRGRTWGPLRPSPIQHATSRFFIRRLASERLLLVKHGPIDERTERQDLTAFLSPDEGQTWNGGLLLDGRTGVSYPDGVQAPDGTIYVIYDYSRTGEREILMARFAEQDVAEGRPVSGAVNLRMLVNKARPERCVRSPQAPQVAL